MVDTSKIDLSRLFVQSLTLVGTYGDTCRSTQRRNVKRLLKTPLADSVLRGCLSEVQLANRVYTANRPQWKIYDDSRLDILRLRKYSPRN